MSIYWGFQSSVMINWIFLGFGTLAHTKRFLKSSHMLKMQEIQRITTCNINFNSSAHTVCREQGLGQNNTQHINTSTIHEQPESPLSNQEISKVSCDQT